MNSSVLLRGVSAGALLLAFASDALAQQALPTIDVGGGHRAPATRGPGAPTGEPARQSASDGSHRNLPSKPKTPEEGYVVRDASTAPRPTSQSGKRRCRSMSCRGRSWSTRTTRPSRRRWRMCRACARTTTNWRLQLQDPRLPEPLHLPQQPRHSGDGNPACSTPPISNESRCLKGPASVLFGRAEPGGLINLITKQPLDSPRYVVEQQIGSFDHYRTQWDFSSPIAQVPGLAYRVSGAYQNNGSFRAFQGAESACSLRRSSAIVRPTGRSSRSTPNILGQSAQSDIGVPTIGPRPAPIPLSRSFQEPNDPRDRIENFNISYKFRQNLNEDWKITNRFLYAAAPIFDKPNITPLCSRRSASTRMGARCNVSANTRTRGAEPSRPTLTWKANLTRSAGNTHFSWGSTISTPTTTITSVMVPRLIPLTFSIRSTEPCRPWPIGMPGSDQISNFTRRFSRDRKGFMFRTMSPGSTGCMCSSACDTTSPT